ncbi:hypothetical protein CRM22_002228 [Opisthorchis felineus]|uniref:Uncharacterized protein n=1 Tax=Opisthorchis felineus TaxID=147828 RepID=A0A4S2M731_OPIFE|nr:hypothetical protein CRM22_002228 [Opisthorchis felineus]
MQLRRNFLISLRCFLIKTFTSKAHYGMNLHNKRFTPGLLSLLGFFSSTTPLLRFQLLDGVCLTVVPPVLGVVVEYFHAILHSAERRPKRQYSYGTPLRTAATAMKNRQQI